MSSVGQKLKDARIAKGLTLDDLQQMTKIQKRYLIAIEEDNYSALPGNFYVRAFARQYAESVGLNPNEIVGEIDDELGMQRKAASQPEATSRVQKREQLEQPHDNGWSAKVAKYLPTTIVVVVVVAILGTIYAVTLGNHKKAQNEQIEQTSTKVAVSTDVKNSDKKKATSHADSSSKKEQKIVSVSSSGSTFTYKVENAPANNTITLSTSNESSWDAVYVGNVEKWQGTLAAGKTQTITVPQSSGNVTISIGNSKASVVKVNGQQLNFLEQNSSLTVRKLVLMFNGNAASNSSTTTGTTQQSQTASTTGTTTTNGTGTTGYQTNNNQTVNNYNNQTTNNYRETTGAATR